MKNIEKMVQGMWYDTNFIKKLFKKDINVRISVIN